MEEEELCCVYVPTNHLYIGDILLVNSKDVIRPNLSVREGIGNEFSGILMFGSYLSTKRTLIFFYFLESRNSCFGRNVNAADPVYT